MKSMPWAAAREDDRPGGEAARRNQLATQPAREILRRRLAVLVPAGDADVGEAAARVDVGRRGLVVHAGHFGVRRETVAQPADRGGDRRLAHASGET
jgi:hypothetical protein